MQRRVLGPVVAIWPRQSRLRELRSSHAGGFLKTHDFFFFSVSCNIFLKARDARIMVDGGYTLGAAAPFDLFPQTRHIESAITFDLLSPHDSK